MGYKKIMRKGIILAGGEGTRLYPLTKSTSKQLLPIYNKPMIYYPLSLLIDGGIKDILIITTPRDNLQFRKLLGDGSQWGISISYEEQEKPNGIAQSFLIAEKWLDNSSSVLILGDNFFFGHGLIDLTKKTFSNEDSATIFLHEVIDPERYGVAKLDTKDNIIDIVEKPTSHISNWAVTGMYCYDKNAPIYTKNLKPSERGELEITDVNIEYMKSNNLYSEVLNDSYMWIDAGTQESFLMASNYVKSVEDKTGTKILCPEEIAFRKGFISSGDLAEIADEHSNSEYGKYLKNVIA